MGNPAIFADAVALIRNGRLEQAVNLLQTAGNCGIAAKGSPVREDHFNQAVAQVQVGDIEGAHATWQKERADFIETRRSGYGER